MSIWKRLLGNEQNKPAGTFAVGPSGPVPLSSASLNAQLIAAAASQVSESEVARLKTLLNGVAAEDYDIALADIDSLLRQHQQVDVQTLLIWTKANIGKGGRVRTVPIPTWVKLLLDQWISAAAIDSGPLFRGINKGGAVSVSGFTENAVWGIVREYAGKLDLGSLAPHDLRRTCARLCRESGGALEQIQLLLGHASIQTTMNYLGTKQNLTEAVNDRLGLAE